MSSYLDITIERGADFQAEVFIEDIEDNPIDITNIDFVATLRNYYTAAPSTSFVVTKTRPTAGLFEIFMPNASTLALKDGNHVWDILAYHPDGTRERILEGQALATPPVSPP